MLSDKNRRRLEGWKFQSPEAPGWHEVISPETSECNYEYLFRLNLQAGRSHVLKSGTLEMHPVLLKGSASISGPSEIDGVYEQYDSFYIPGGTEATITAVEDCIFYVAGAVCEGIGQPARQSWNSDEPLGEIHQIHGEGAGEREVMFTLPPSTPASRLICGITRSGPGAWTSWPPHQHDDDLEEVYCYFEMDSPHVGFHISYLESGGLSDAVVHTVESGTFVEVPKGYHPTVASPGTVNTYFWVLAAHTPRQRRYDLAVEDPTLENLRG